MASEYYYSNSSNNQGPALPLHLCLFLLTLLLFVGLSWYMSYESAVQSIIDNVKFVLMVSPVVLLLAVHLISSFSDGRWVPFFIPLTERDSLHRVGGSPWGVALVLVIVMFLISYQSYFHERWFPLLSR